MTDAAILRTIDYEQCRVHILGNALTDTITEKKHWIFSSPWVLTLTVRIQKICISIPGRATIIWLSGHLPLNAG